MTIDISNNAARVNYTVASGVTQTSFSVPFEFFNDSDLSVYVDDVLKTITTHYTVSGGDGSTGTITMSVTGAAGGSTVVISRSIAIERTSDFVTGVDINRAALNTQLDTLTAIAADNQDKANRSITAPNSEVNPVLELPDADTRKGKLIGFNETTGNIELSATLADGNTLASISGDIATLADIEDGTDATDAIQTAASISSDITTAASNITEIQNASANAATATTKAAEAATSASNAATSATNASTSETNAATSETNAATSASTATTQAGISTTKATESAASAAAALASKNAATTSESNASTSESNSSNSATLSEASRIASVAAQAAAETAETNAETAETNAASSASAASTSASNASTSETNAATSAATATTQAGIATTKAGEAATSATSAASSASSAQASKDAALAALDSFDDRYLGQKTADPTLDNDGDALVSGALYFNTTDDIMKVYDGSLWVAAYASLSGAMFGANNLSDVADAAGSRANLGLGTGDTPTFAGINTTGNATFGDNDKAIFGSGGNLEIYTDGNTSIIKENTAGYSLQIRAEDQVFMNTAGNSTGMYINPNAAVSLYHANSPKLATTATGIDVTGEVTADGLLVEGETAGQGASIEAHATVTEFGDALLIARSDNASNNLHAGVKIQGSNNPFYIYQTNGANTNKLRFNYNSMSDAGGQMTIDNNGDLSLYDSTGTTPKFFWDASAESLGIGTASPSQGIHLKAASGNSYIKAERTTASQGEVGFNTDNWYMYQKPSSSDLHFYNTADRLTIDSSGKVGIGTSTPDVNLHIKGNDGLVIEDDGTTNFFRIQTSNSGDAVFYTGSGGTPTERMRIDSSGSLLVGKTSTGYNSGSEISHEDFIRVNRTNGSALYVGRNSSDGELVSFRKDGSTVGSIGAYGGDVYIGTGDAGLWFQDGGNAIRPFRVDTQAGHDASIDLGHSSNRFKDLYLSGTANAANFNTTSDATLKTNVETLTGSLDAVKSLRGVSFDWLENGNSEVGVIAQEVEAVLPDVVSTNDQGIKSVKYGNMVALLIEAMKEQQLRIEALEAKLGE